MLVHRSTSRRLAFPARLLCFILITALISGCQGLMPQATPVPSPTVSASHSIDTVNRAEITFLAHLPEKLADNQSLSLELLDEVTGLAMNPIRVKMETGDQINYTVKIPAPIGSVLKYRYVRDNDPEYNSLNQQVRYRMYIVEGPGMVQDTITGWKDALSDSKLGRIRGQVANKVDKAPVVNALVVAGGLQTLTASDGSFLLEGLPPGTHNLVVYSLDGAFSPFQQGAVVGDDTTTPALVMLTPTKLVNVTFHLQSPEETIPGAPIRLVGNLASLGNTFADLNGGLSTLASRAPGLSAQSDGVYILSLKLPAGLDLRYKYSLGDGFWNAEHTANGEMRIRQVIIPDHDVVIEDKVDTWKTSGFAPVTFSVTVPSDTPANDIVSIQFNPYGWTNPIPMWPVGKNQWAFTLFSPLDAFSNITYRYCRNDQCGSADAIETSGPSAKGLPFTPKETEQHIDDTVSAWAWFGATEGTVTVSGQAITSTTTPFQAGVEWMTGYRPSWQPYLAAAFQNASEIGANYVMLTPTWHVTRQNPPVIELVPGQDALWNDMTQAVSLARQKGLEVSLHPVLIYGEDPNAWWKAGVRDTGWWQTWFARYRAFILYFADMAAQTGAKALVIGDGSLLPALPGGSLADGSPSGLPGDMDQQWSQLISEVRTRFTGKIIWLLPDGGSLPPLPDFLKSVDALYIQMSAPLLDAAQPSQSDLEAGFAALLDGDILKAQQSVNKPVLIGLQYPSVSGAANGCAGGNAVCLSSLALNQPRLGNPQGDLSLNAQADIYNAAMTVISQRSWISGIFASGYNPAVELRDTSTSIRSKPASDILWYWFPRLTGVKK